jgi:sugar phosphate isomerase/epimerase
VAATIEQLRHLRDERPTYLSWHLPNLAWDGDTASITGGDVVAQQIDDGRACGVNAFTVHVPRIGAGGMFAPNDSPSDTPSAAWETFLTCYEMLFREALSAGIHVSIENIHNQPGTPADQSSREFDTEIGELLA